MWIHSTREAHAGGQFKDTRVGELNDGAAVSFSASGTAQVSAEVGEYLTSTYGVFEATDDDDDETGAAADEEPDDEATATVVAADDDDPTDDETN